MSRSILYAALACGLLAWSGCRPAYDSTDLQGAFSIDGQPVVKGGVTFTPLDKNRGTGVYAPVVDGRYEARKVPLGKIRVTFIAMKPTGKMIDFNTQQVPEMVSMVPAKYENGLDLDVSRDMTHKEFSLDSK